ncbi:AAA domain-containing protein [Niabella sp. CJ426]|uniref:AAA domain-containing protein n=1 Tax=Niabella sp. CJ426 TaxID=3393740 RepID=UPI003D03EFA3
MSTVTTFQQYLQSAFVNGPMSTDEVVEFVLPLFEEVASFHENGMVGSFENPDTVFLTNGRLDIDENYTHAPVTNFQALQTLLEQGQINGYAITERTMVDTDVSQHSSLTSNLYIQPDAHAPLNHPVYLRGYQCYEMKLGHHDAQTDIFCLGLILASAVMGLDLYNIEDLNQFAVYRNQPAGLNARIHPTLCALVTEMTELNRDERYRDLEEAIQQLKYYRDYDPQRQTDLSTIAAFQTKKNADRKTFVLDKLRNRLFDTSRRNRLLYYKANSRFCNLTVSSVPMVLHYQSINPQLLFTWNEEVSKQIISMKDISLNKYLRFEDHPYLDTQLNSIRLQSENDKKEFGFSQLKLVVAFLHWHNLKENTNERIQSPLLLLPVEIDRKKSLKEERFTLHIIDNAAIINPVLSNFLKDLYGIELPESIDFDDVSMQAFFELLRSKIEAAKQGVKINYIEKPRIKIVHHIARQTINNYRKRLKLKGNPSFHQIDYSYSKDDFKPLGLQLYQQKIKPLASDLEFLLNNDIPAPNVSNFAASSAVKSTFALADGENNPYSWDFDVCNMVLGNFNYKKMSLVSDYNLVTTQQIEHPVFNELFSSEPRQLEDSPSLPNAPEQWHHVIEADPTQARAVSKSREGKSYIIQGPPGTGKSQTITNLIADFLANEKTVLFVCEKRAALDVVYHRLQQNQLAELCCYIHDSQGDKKEFIKDLKNVYEDFLKNKMDLHAISEERAEVLKRLIAHINILKEYHEQQKSVSIDAGIATRSLYDVLMRLKDQIPGIDTKGQDIPQYANWVRFGEVIEQLGKTLDDTGAEPAFASHPFHNLSTGLINADNPFGLMNSILNHAQESLQQLQQLSRQYGIPPAHATKLQSIKNLIEDALVLEPLAKTGNLKLVDIQNKESREFEDTYRQYQQLKNDYEQMLTRNSKWQNRFDEQEVMRAMDIAAKHEKSFFGFLNGDWRRLKKQLKQSYDFAAHQIKPSFSEVLQQLQKEYEANEKVGSQKKSLEQKYNIHEVEQVYAGIETLRGKQGDQEVDFLLQHSEANGLVLKLSQLNNSLHQLELELQQCLYEYENKTCNELKDELASISNNSGALKDLLPTLKKFSALPEVMQSFIRKVPVSPVQAEALMAHRTLERLVDRNPQFASTNSTMLRDTTRQIGDDYKKLLKLNSDYIRAKRRNTFLKNYDLSNAAISTLSTEERTIKKDYTEGRKILEREMGKTMRYKSIREMASNESGKVLKDIKPVWLMSPLSVSDSLPMDTGFFDVVIFDEASQITLEEGIPALFRAPQCIIVGDDKQMPPSNFFSAKTQDPEDLEIIEGEAADEILSSESDSLLMQGARKLNSTMLSWHYRSRFETLISYSNHAFYQAGLLTIPDRTTQPVEKPLLEVQKPDEGLENAGALLTGSISFHYLPNSIYEARSNVHEAKYIAYMVSRLLLDEVEDTIGIVAFSQEQQGIIEEAIDQLALSDKKLEEVLEKAFNRKDNGQYTGLFVKNLENVQGDERDIIIMSVCYGHDANKKMLMNFGPINKKGGEKRLNVIFSRARKHMAVVSSIRHYHITNDYNAGANYFKRFLHYAEMVSTGNMNNAVTILKSLNANEQHNTRHLPAEISAVAADVKRALQNKGYFIEENIGHSGFKCSLGLKKSVQDNTYSLGILVDDETHYRNNDLMEQYYQRPQVLQNFGWSVFHVYAKDWCEDKDLVIAQLEKTLNNTPSDLPRQKQQSEPDTNHRQTNTSDNDYRRFMSPDNERFWEIRVQALQLFTRTGKTGSNGLIQVKSFDTEEAVELALKAAIEEQEANGYTEK